MSIPRSRKAIRILYTIVLVLLAGSLVTTGFLWWLGDWEGHPGALTLALRIVWGCWLVVLLSAVLTRMTIFGWYFRRYFRWPQDGEAPPVPRPAAVVPDRPVRAPWPKSGKASFSITVVLVSLTGTAAVGTVVMWILEGVTGRWVFWLVTSLIWIGWWVAVITTVLTRIALFGVERQRARQQHPPEEAAGVGAAAPPGPGGHDKPTL
jgi:hypothetical protein